MAFRTVLAGIALAAASLGLAAPAQAEAVKIGFVVKQPEEPWFQDEWRFAKQAAKEKGFTVVTLGGEDGEKVLDALNNLGAQGAQGVIICVPDVKLGPSIVATAAQNKLKLFTVDDRLVDGTGKPIDSVPHMGISATKIGEQVGQSIADEMKRRGWNASEVGALKISYDELPTAVDRVTGAISTLTKAGFPEKNIFDAPQRKTNTEEAFNAASIVIAKHPEIKKWIAFGLNDEAVLGAVRALEGAGIAADSTIGIGIGGADSAINEFKKPTPTGFFGTVIISPKRHGYETASLVYDWVANGKEPPKLTLTSGVTANRDNYHAVRKDLGLE